MTPPPPVFRRAYVDGVFGQMHVRRAQPETPSARPVMCIHLSPLSGVVYEKFLEHIGTDRIAVAPDTPGYGMSDGPAEAPDIETYAAAMARLLDEMEFEAVDLIGYGSGSKIAFQTALDLPDRIRHVALISAPDYTEEETEHIRAGERKPWGPRAAFAYRYRDKLPDLKAPLLVVNINNEITEPTRRLSEVLQKDRYVERMDWRHGFLHDSPGEFAALVRAFFDGPS